MGLMLGTTLVCGRVGLGVDEFGTRCGIMYGVSATTGLRWQAVFGFELEGSI